MELTPTADLEAAPLAIWYGFGEPFLSTLKVCYDIIESNQDVFDPPHKREMTTEQLRVLCNKQLIVFSRGLLKHFKKGEFVRDFRVFSVTASVLF